MKKRNLVSLFTIVAILNTITACGPELKNSGRDTIKELKVNSSAPCTTMVLESRDNHELPAITRNCTGNSATFEDIKVADYFLAVTPTAGSGFKSLRQEVDLRYCADGSESCTQTLEVKLEKDSGTVNLPLPDLKGSTTATNTAAKSQEDHNGGDCSKQTYEKKDLEGVQNCLADGANMARKVADAQGQLQDAIKAVTERDPKHSDLAEATKADTRATEALDKWSALKKALEGIEEKLLNPPVDPTKDTVLIKVNAKDGTTALKGCVVTQDGPASLKSQLTCTTDDKGVCEFRTSIYDGTPPEGSTLGRLVFEADCQGYKLWISRVNLKLPEGSEFTLNVRPEK